MFFIQKPIEESSSVTIDINTFIQLRESAMNLDDYIDEPVVEGAASWETYKVVFGGYKKKSKELWKEAKKLEKVGEYSKAVKKYNESISELKKIYPVINSIPDENIYDFLVGFLPFISGTLWGITIVGTVINKGKLKGASRAYAKTELDNFIKMLEKKRDKCKANM